MHPEETDVHPVLLLEGKHGSGTVGEIVQHLSRVHISGEAKLEQDSCVDFVQYSASKAGSEFTQYRTHGFLPAYWP